MSERIPRWVDGALTCGSFPLIFGGALLGYVLGAQAGVALELLVPGVIGVGGLSIIALERVHPHEPRWNRDHDDLRTDAFHLLVTMILMPETVRALTFGTLFVLSTRLTEWLGTGLWPTEWPLVLQGVSAIVLTELPYYWWHRLQHETGLLWRLHALHHSSLRMYWLNAARFHPLDTLVAYVVQLPLLALLGAPEVVLGFWMVFTGVFGLFQHANVKIRLGGLNWFFDGPELHRFHHSLDPVEGNTNYGGTVIVWDIVFGTRFAPDREASREIGLVGMPAFPTGYLAQLASPFRWRAIQRQAPSASSAAT